MQILAVKNITKHFDGVAAIDSLSLTLERGQITAIVGPNGSGKTTLVNVVSGLIPIDTGSFRIGKIIVQKLKPYEVSQLGITRTFQTIRLFTQMTVLDNILVVLTNRGIFASFFEKHNASDLTIAKEVLQKVGLFEKREHLVASLSYGQRKLLEIARVLATCQVMKHKNIGILLFDEPAAGLSVHMLRITTAILADLRKRGNAVLLIEHNMDLIRELADFVYVMDSGRLLAQGKPNDVLAQKKVIEAYIGE